jgi:hypothetical protein
MATPNPAQQISEEISTLQTRINALQGNVQLTKSREAVEDLQTNINGMAQRIFSLRTRGYVFEKDMESQAQAFVTSWALLYPNLQAQINTQSSALVNSLRPVEMQMPQLAAMAGNPGAARGLLASLQSAVDQLESKVTAAEGVINGMYDQFNNQVYTATRHLEDIEYLLTQLAEASFQLLPTEAGIAGVKAIWCKTGKEQKGDPQGVLYLTDQRLIFEQKEEIATKKVLFVVTEKQKVQGLQLEAPVALVDKVETSQQGLLKNEDHIEIHFLSGSPVQTAHFHIWQDNVAWQALINRAKSKDFDQGRAVAIDQAAVERVKSAPTQCPSCGGAITTVVLRGMDSIKCEYCGMVIRLVDGPSTAPVVAETKELTWGTSAPILVRLGTQNSSVTANGKCSVVILDPAVYQQKIGNDSALQVQVRALLALKLGDVLAQIGSGIVNPDGLGARLVQIAGTIQEAANPGLAGMGVKLTRVTIDGFNVSPANI